MLLNSLTALSPIDGRYRKQTQSLAPYFSEFGLIKYRVFVEVQYFLALCKFPIPNLKSVPASSYEAIAAIAANFTEAEALEIKEIEKTTNHDVKAVEYFIKAKFEKIGLAQYSEFIHFGLTSQDINNTAIPLSLKNAYQEIIRPLLASTIVAIDERAALWQDIPMLAKTHGQPASPTRLGKELRVFVERLQAQLSQLDAVPFSAKFGGATGNFNAHHVAYGNIDWKTFGNTFVNDTLGLSRSQTTTQIEHYDNLAAFADASKRINTILIDFARDVWQYVAMNYFKQKIKAGEIGSSAMPHKVNPIDFENAEGNLGMANAMLEHFAAKLPISRLQRDLTDSTVLRNLGVPFSHMIVSFQSLMKGIEKLELNVGAIESDLEENWAVVAEAIQTVLRREGFPKPYEALKDLTRKNEKITQKSIQGFIDGLYVGENIKTELRAISPSSFTGI